MYNHQLDTFLMIAECGSFSLAAKRLFITPSAVVQKVNMFEKQLGVQLFQRTKQGVSLTPAGEILLQEAPKMIQLSDAIMKQMKKTIDTKIIRVGWKSEVEDAYFFSRCITFRDTHPEIDITISNLRGEVLTAVKHQELDLCEYMNSPVYKECGYSFSPVYSAHQCIVVSSKHPLANRKCISIEDLENQPLVMLQPGILSDHDAFHNFVIQTGSNIKLLPRNGYGGKTQEECFRNNYPFLGVDALSHWYAPLRCIPTTWGIPVEIGLVYRTDSQPWLNAMIDYLLNAKA